MKKIIILLFLIASGCIQKLSAQAPAEMTYQVMVLDPTSGKVMSNEDVKIRIEIRQDKDDPQSAVFSQDFDVRTDVTGICNLTLELSANIDWSTNNYFVTYVNNIYCGGNKITSVPYSLYAAQAASLEGIISKKYLEGIWKCTLESKGDQATATFTFNSDGTGSYLESGYEVYDNHSYTFTWKVNSAGVLALFITSEKDGNYIKTYYTLKNDKDQIVLACDGHDGDLYIRQK